MEFNVLRARVKKLVDGGARDSAINKYLKDNGYSREEFIKKNKSTGNFNFGNMARSIGQGATFGLGDEIKAGVQSILPKFLGGGNYDEIVAREREQIKVFQQKYPKTALTTEILSSIAPTIGALILTAPAGGSGGVATTTATASRLAPLLARVFGGGTKGTLKSGAIAGGSQGALYGAGTSEGGVVERGKGALTGGAIGSVTGGVLEKFSNLLSPSAFGNALQRVKDVNVLQREGVPMTLGGLLGEAGRKVESAYESLPLFGSLVSGAKERQLEKFNEVTFNRALKHIGEKLDNNTQMGGDALNEVYTKISKRYDEVIPQTSLNYKQTEELQNEVEDLILGSVSNVSRDSPVFNSALDEVDKILFQSIDAGNLSGESLKKAYSQFGKIVSQYKGSMNVEDQKVGQILREVQSAIMDKIKQANPKQGKELDKINKAFSEYKVLENVVKKQNQNKLFSGSQLVNAVRESDLSGGKRLSSTGLLPMSDLAGAGKRELSNKLANSGTADRIMQNQMMAGTLPLVGGGIAGNMLGDATLGVLATSIPTLAYTDAGMRLINKMPTVSSRYLANSLNRVGTQTPLSLINYDQNVSGLLQ